MKMGNMVNTRRRRFSGSASAQSGLSLKANSEQHGQNSLKSRELGGVKPQSEANSQLLVEMLSAAFCV
jgi:hypothetical protein